MSLPTTVTYSAFTDFQAYTRVPEYTQPTFTEAKWKPAALHAEFIIDYVIGATDRYDVHQKRKFPIKDCQGNAVIPIDIEKAHIEITTWVLLSGKQQKDEASQRTTEAWSSSGYSYSGVGNATPKILLNELPLLAQNILRQYSGSTAPLFF